jgi:hypothetical protein
MKNVISAIALLTLLLSCGTNSKNEEGHDAGPIYIPIKDCIKKEEKVHLSSYNKNIRYIPLETTRESLIRKIDKLIITDKYILVSDFFNLYAFNAEGKFIRKISRRGNSYDEYTNYVDEILYNEANKSFYLITQGKMILFNSELTYYKYITIDFESFCAITDQSNRFVFYTGKNIKFEYEKGDLYNIIETDTLINIINKYINHSPRIRPEKGGTFGIFKRPLYIYNNTVYFNEFGNDTLVIVDEGEYKPAVIFDLGNYKMDPNPHMINPEEERRVMDNLKQKVFIQDIFEDDKLLYIVLSWGFGEEVFDYILYEKNTKKLMNLGSNKFYNDIDGGMSFFPKLISNNLKIDWISAEEFKNHFSSTNKELYINEYGEKYEFIYNLGLSLSFDDNPIIVISE